MQQNQTGVAVAGRQHGLLGDVYRRYWLEVCRYVGRTFGAGPPDPEDVAQTAFTRFAALEDPGRVENPKAFLFATARNIVVDHHRREATRNGYAREQVAAAREDAIDAVDPERVLLAKERLALLEEVLWRMPRKRRRMLIMSRFDGLSYAEISRRTGVSLSVVRRHVERGIADFQKALRVAGLGDREG